MSNLVAPIQQITTNLRVPGGFNLGPFSKILLPYAAFEQGKKVFNPDYNMIHAVGNLGKAVSNIGFGTDYEYSGKDPAVDAANRLRIKAGGKDYSKKPTSRAASLPPDYKRTEADAFRESPDRPLQPDFIRDITRAPNDPNNTGAKGTQMGGIGRMTYDQFRGDILEPLGVQQRSGFSSTNLPGQPGYGASFPLETRGEDGELLPGVTTETVIGGDGPEVTEITGIDPSKIRNEDGELLPGYSVEWSTDDEVGAPGKITYSGVDQKTGTAEEKAQSGLMAALEGVKAMEREDTPENRRLRARSAFLDYDGPGGSLGALRARDDVMGVATQGGKSFLIDPEAEGGLRDISTEARKAISSGMMSQADALAQFPLGGVQAEVKPDEPVSDPASAVSRAASRLAESATEAIAEETPVPPVQVVKTEAIPQGEAALQEYFKKLDAGTLPASSYVRR